MNKGKIYAIRQARTWLKQSPLYLDTETTGLSSTDEIIDLALIDHNNTALIDTLIRPTFPISAKASEIHGISNEDVDFAPGFGEIMVNLIKLTKDRLILIYNADFDLRMLHQSAWIGSSKTLYIYNVGCVMKLYAEFHGEWNDYHQSYKWKNQEAAARQLGLDVPADLHRAAADAQLCRQIVLAVATTKPPEEEPTK